MKRSVFAVLIILLAVCLHASAEPTYPFDSANVNSFDRTLMKSYDKKLDDAGTVLEIAALLSPAVLFSESPDQYLKIGVMYAETLALAWGTTEIIKRLADRPRPYMYYDGYPQIENGVGMMTSMEKEIDDELPYLSEDCDIAAARELSVATGEAAYKYILKQVAKIEKICYNTKVHVYKIENEFFGRSITVAGLICGCDLLKQLQGKELGDKLLLPSVMLRAQGDLFLDGTSLDELSAKLGVPVEVRDCSGDGFLRGILGF